MGGGQRKREQEEETSNPVVIRVIRIPLQSPPSWELLFRFTTLLPLM